MKPRIERKQFYALLFVLAMLIVVQESQGSSSFHHHHQHSDQFHPSSSHHHLLHQEHQYPSEEIGTHRDDLLSEEELSDQTQTLGGSAAFVPKQNQPAARPAFLTTNGPPPYPTEPSGTVGSISTRTVTTTTSSSTMRMVMMMEPPDMTIVLDMARVLDYVTSLNEKLQQTTAPSTTVVEEPHRRNHGSLHHGVVYRIPLLCREDTTSSTPRMQTIFHHDDSNTCNTESLATFLNNLFRTLSIHPSKDQDFSLILTLAFLYMDRASSVDTPRNSGTVVKCPFCTPNTVHRLFTTAVLLAMEAVRGTTHTLAQMNEIVTNLLPGQPSLSDLSNMLRWMQSALGDDGYFVNPVQLNKWRVLWSNSRSNVGTNKRRSKPRENESRIPESKSGKEDPANHQPNQEPPVQQRQHVQAA